MSRWGISSIFWPSMASQASRERSRPSSVYRSYSIQTSAAPSPASHRMKHRVSDHAEYHGRDHREPRESREKRRGRESYSYGSHSYNHDCDYEYAYAYPQHTYSTTAPYYSSKPSSSTASSASTTAATAAPHRRSQHRHTSARYKKEEDRERVSNICYGGGDARGHRYYASYQDYKNEKAKNPKKRVHWADEEPVKSSSRKGTSTSTRESKSKPSSYHYSDDRSGREPQSPRHRHSDISYGYDDEVDRRSRKTRSDHQQRWY